MDWLQVLTILGSTIGMFLWSRSEAKSDRECNATDRRLLQASMDANRREAADFFKAIHEEMKDFHTRLCNIEAARK